MTFIRIQPDRRLTHIGPETVDVFPVDEYVRAIHLDKLVWTGIHNWLRLAMIDWSRNAFC